MKQRTNCILTELDVRGRVINYQLQLPIPNNIVPMVRESGRMPTRGEIVIRGNIMRQFVEYSNVDFDTVWMVKLEWQKAIANEKSNFYANLANSRHEELNAILDDQQEEFYNKEHASALNESNLVTGDAKVVTINDLYNPNNPQL